MALHPAFLHRLDVVKASLYHYSLPLASGESRKGLLLHLHESDTWVEAAPLPGRSRETFDEARDQLLGLFSSPVNVPLYPSVQFALESALMPSLQFPLCVPVWGLLSGSCNQILEQVERAIKAKATHIKIKIGGLSKVEVKFLLEQLRDVPLEMRLDCNRAYTFDDAVELFHNTPFLIEEPTYEIDQLHALPFPFALDETLEEFPDLPLDSCPQLTTLILKPTIHGGKSGCARFASSGKKIIYTGAYESGVGTLNIVQMARTETLGISTYCFLREDVFQQRLALDGSHLVIEERPQITLAAIQEIAQGNLINNLK